MVKRDMPDRASMAGSRIRGAIHGSKGSTWFWGLQGLQAWAWGVATSPPWCPSSLLLLS